MTGSLDNVMSYAASVLRLGFGMQLAPGARTPEKRLIAYEFEACPYCRKAREAASHLGLDVEVRPVAKGSPRRDELRERGGKMQVPYLLDPNTGKEMYESDDITRHLYQTYGAGRVPVLLKIGYLGNLLSFLATAMRPMRGLRVVAGRKPAPEALLELYNMESSPYCRKAREALSELDLPYVARNVPRGSPARAELEARGGKVQVPYLVDPNTGTEMYESDDIVRYLYRTYGPG